jgi:adenylate kinase
MNVVILGAPGSGKGTQARMLSEAFGLLHISTGDMLRKEIEEGTDLGMKAKGYVESGMLVPDDLIVDMVRRRISSDGRDFILDGFPRNVAQARELDKLLLDLGRALDLVLYIEVPEGEVIRRLGGRRVCPSCGENYHVEFKPPKVEGICDVCGASLRRREDDEEGAIRRRLSVYREQTSPLISFYMDRGMLTVVDGVGSPEEVHRRIVGLFSRG